MLGPGYTFAMCSGPECELDAYADGLCAAHYQQRRRHPSRPLRPLRASPGTGRVMVGLRVSKEAAKAVDRDRAGAEEAVEKWARR